jgi:predicted PurR-regulated permease PerM
VQRKNLQTTFLFIALAIVIALSFMVYAPFFQVLAVAAMAAVVTNRFHRRLTTLLHGWDGLSAFLTVLAVVTLVLVPVLLLGNQVFDEALNLYHNLSVNGDQYFKTFEKAFSEPFKGIAPNFTFSFGTYATQALNWFTNNLGSLFSSTVEVVANVLLFLVAFYYFLKDGKRFSKSLMALSPLVDRYDQEVFDRMEGAVVSIVRGQLMVAMIQGTLTGVGFTLFGVPNPAVWGCMAAICALVPGVGTSLVNIPAVIFLFATGHTLPGFGELIWASTAVGLIDNAIGPYLIGRGAHVHPLLVLFAVLGGVSFFGPMGFLLGPLTVSLLLALLDLYRLLILKERAILTTRLEKL